jgi:hypothetical protein
MAKAASTIKNKVVQAMALDMDSVYNTRPKRAISAPFGKLLAHLHEGTRRGLDLSVEEPENVRLHMARLCTLATCIAAEYGGLC